MSTSTSGYSSDEYFSSFGGLWTDRRDVNDEIDRRLADGRLNPEQGEMVRTFVRQGYLILPGAVPEAICDELRRDIEHAWKTGDGRLKILPPGSAEPLALQANAPTQKMRAVDIYVFFESARRALFSPAIVEFLSLIFERKPQLFQSLSFEQGSQQGMHQDTAYVVTDSPLEFAGCWIALEDVREHSGELMYFEGSHRLPEYKFSGQFKHWSSTRDGPEQHEEWSRRILTKADELGMPYRTFLPKKGDALIWAADLAHGGTPTDDADATRKSIVGHFCPVGVSPNYFSYRPDRTSIVEYGEGGYSSEHFDISVPIAAASAASGPSPSIMDKAAAAVRRITTRARQRVR